MSRQVLFVASTLSPVLPIVFGWKRSKNLIWAYAWFCLFCEIILLLLKFSNNPYRWVGNLFYIGEFLLISTFYRKELFQNRTWFYLLIVGLSINFIAGICKSSVMELDAFSTSIFLAAYLIYCVASFYKMMQKPEVLHVEKTMIFWVGVAFLFYASGNYILFVFKDYLIASNEQWFLLLWSSSYLILNILKNMFLAVGLHQKKV